MDARDVKAMELTGNSRISYVAGVWMVPSQSTSARHKVDPSPTNPSCSCEDFELRQRPCKHILAVRALLERQIKGEPHPDPATIPARPKRPTYKQDWPNYNLAQTNEKDHFQILLADLCQAIPQPTAKGGGKGGRPTAPLSDVVFSAVFKVYSTLSARRFMSDLREAHERRCVSELVSYNTVLRYLDSPDVTPILTDLITRSSLPLRTVEVDFATDSSGFSTSRYVKWFDEKYGVTKEKAEWVKAHLCVGVKTNVVTAAYVGDKNSADCPQFPALVRKTAENFTVREVSADKAFLSNENLNLVDALGGTAFVPFKCNSLATGAPLWERMYGYFHFRRDEFLAHYHKRSNVESTFSMMKRKFGDAVRAKGDTAMVNEVLAKVVCHNLCCVISAWYELGIEPAAWAPVSKPDAVPQNPVVLPLNRG